MLPSIEQAQEFLRLVNVGRQAMDLEPLEYLDFDGAKPGAPMRCLSATNLFASAGYMVGAEAVRGAVGYDQTVRVEVPRAIGCKKYQSADENPMWNLPAGIRVVTDPFDEEEPGLRERLVEAGVVAPLGPHVNPAVDEETP